MFEKTIEAPFYRREKRKQKEATEKKKDSRKEVAEKKNAITSYRF